MESVGRKTDLWSGVLLALFCAVLAVLILWARYGTKGPSHPPDPTTSTTASPSTSGPEPTTTEPQDDTEGRQETARVIHRTSTTRAARSTVRASTPSTAVVRPPSGTRTIAASAYCLRGTMANGRQVHDGAVASNVLPMGSKWRVLGGPLDGRVLTVEDTGGPRVTLDVWMASCHQAIVFGRPSLRIERV